MQARTAKSLIAGGILARLNQIAGFNQKTAGTSSKQPTRPRRQGLSASSSFAAPVLANPLVAKPSRVDPRLVPKAHWPASRHAVDDPSTWDCGVACVGI